MHKCLVTMLQYIETLVKFLWFSTVTSFPDGCFDMSALNRLERAAGIHIFNKLAPNFLNIASVLHFDEPTLDSLRIENNPVEGSKSMLKAWVLGKSSLPSTWQVLLEKLKSINMGELVQEIEQFFSTTPVMSPSVPLQVSHVPVCHVCIMQLSTLVHNLSFSFSQDV